MSIYSTSSAAYQHALSSLERSLTLPDHKDTHGIPVVLDSAIGKGTSIELPPLAVPVNQTAQRFFQDTQKKFTVDSIHIENEHSDRSIDTLGVAHILTSSNPCRSRQERAADFINFVVNDRFIEVSKQAQEYKARHKRIDQINHRLERLNGDFSFLRGKLNSLSSEIHLLQEQAEKSGSSAQIAASKRMDEAVVLTLVAEQTKLLAKLEEKEEALKNIRQGMRDIGEEIDELNAEKKELLAKEEPISPSSRSSMGCLAELRAITRIRDHFLSLAKEQLENPVAKRLSDPSLRSSESRLAVWLENCTDIESVRTAEVAQAEFERRAQEQEELLRQQEEAARERQLTASSGYGTGSTATATAVFDDHTVAEADLEVNLTDNEWELVPPQQPIIFAENKPALIAARDRGAILGIEGGKFSFAHPSLHKTSKKDVVFVLVDKSYGKGIYVLKKDLDQATSLLKALFIGTDGKATHECESFFSGYDFEEMRPIVGQTYDPSKADSQFDITAAKPAKKSFFTF